MLFLLLLLILPSRVSGTLVLNVAQRSYQAEENQNITLEWTFSTRTDPPLRSIYTICQLYTDVRTHILFHLHEGVESPESQDPQFAGRVQWDKEVLTGGRLTLHVSRLRTNDSGMYVCDILVRPDGSNSRGCWLNVTAAAELQTQRPPESPQPRESTTREFNQRDYNQRDRDTSGPTLQWQLYCLSVSLSLSKFGLREETMVKLLRR
ncbi:uncharacterized protein LOC134876208 isoform X2 [Eleginops maclovinus]